MLVGEANILPSARISACLAEHQGTAAIPMAKTIRLKHALLLAFIFLRGDFSLDQSAEQHGGGVRGGGDGVWKLLKPLQGVDLEPPRKSGQFTAHSDCCQRALLFWCCNIKSVLGWVLFSLVRGLGNAALVQYCKILISSERSVGRIVESRTDVANLQLFGRGCRYLL